MMVWMWGRVRSMLIPQPELVLWRLPSHAGGVRLRAVCHPWRNTGTGKSTLFDTLLDNDVHSCILHQKHHYDNFSVSGFESIFCSFLCWNFSVLHASGLVLCSYFVLLILVF